MAPQRIPGVPYAAPPRAEGYASALDWPPRLIVLHDTGNNSSDRFDEASYSATRTDARTYWTSCHCFADPGGLLGSLRLDRQAWAAKSYGNRVGLHIEMCRTAAGVSAATRAVVAPLVRQLCEMTGIPMVKLTPAQVKAGNRGICGHRDFTLAGIDGNDHGDPGPSFPWAGFMAQVIGSTPTPEVPDVDAAQNQRLTNLDQQIFALGQLDPIADGVTVSGVSDADGHMELPLVSLLNRVDDNVKAIKDVHIPPLHGTDGEAPAASQVAIVVAALESAAGQAAIRKAIRDQADDNPAT